jgi:hypothetical protein
MRRFFDKRATVVDVTDKEVIDLFQDGLYHRRVPGRSVLRLDHACATRPGASARRAARRRLLRLRRAFGCLGTSRGSSSTTSPTPRIWVPRLLVGRSHWLSPCIQSLHLAARLLVIGIAPALLHLCRPSGRAVSPLDFSSVGRTGSRHVPVHSVMHRDYPSHDATDILQLRRASGCLGTSRRSSRGLSRRSSLTTSPHAGSSWTT